MFFLFFNKRGVIPPLTPPLTPKRSLFFSAIKGGGVACLCLLAKNRRAHFNALVSDFSQHTSNDKESSFRTASKKAIYAVICGVALGAGQGVYPPAPPKKNPTLAYRAFS
ncbi:hypothetical protein BJI48_08995 [Helicobacter sp. 11S02596-1]|nr:hypothetical protein BJI48_08995 [Helicobacter sp. 11S02596-1]